MSSKNWSIDYLLFRAVSAVFRPYHDGIISVLNNVRPLYLLYIASPSEIITLGTLSSVYFAFMQYKKCWYNNTYIFICCFLHVYVPTVYVVLHCHCLVLWYYWYKLMYLYIVFTDHWWQYIHKTSKVRHALELFWRHKNINTFLIDLIIKVGTST